LYKYTIFFGLGCRQNPKIGIRTKSAKLDQA
jgi:hypothetical protein